MTVTAVLGGMRCVLVRYVGRLKSNGKVFDKTDKKPFAFRLGECCQATAGAVQRLPTVGAVQRPPIVTVQWPPTASACLVCLVQ